MTEETPYNRMRRAASWLEANGVDWAMYNIEEGVISFGYTHDWSDKCARINELCRGHVAIVNRRADEIVSYYIKPTETSFGFRWYIWTKRHVAETETVVIE